MAFEAERTVRQSIIDRLIDEEPRLAADPPLPWNESLRRYKQTVLRDIEWLLNNRRTIEPATAPFPELQKSAYNYGLPDVTSLSADSEQSRLKLMRNIEECVALFEPRLTAVRVSLPEAQDNGGRRIRFVIEALLRMEPNPERVAFDTVLDTCSGNIMIAGNADA